MNKYFFYTDPTKVKTPQLANQTFGPVSSSDSEFNPTKDKYRTTNLHTTDTAQPNAAPAIAICDGMICVQEDNNGTYSIILKPNYQPPFDFPFIKYFIYKGIKKDSLVKTGTEELADSLTTGAIPFIDEIIGDTTHWNKQGNDITKSASVIGLGYETGFMHTINGNPVDIFKDDQPIDNLFYYPSPDFQLPSVKAGDKIGEFDTEFGFEIVLERLGYEPKISLARTFTNYISVSAIDNRLNEIGHASGITWQVDDADYFLHWHAKEECLNYIDPCAFYGSFCRAKVFYCSGTSLSKKVCRTSKDIYEDILDKVAYQNKNNIYLDIRDEFTYSALHSNDKNLTFKLIEKGVSIIETDIGFNRNNWSIITLKESDFSSIDDELNSVLKFALDNGKKIVVLENTKPEPRLSLLNSSNQYSDTVKINIKSFNNHLIASYHNIYLKYVNNTPSYPNITPKDEFKGDNLLSFSKSIYGTIQLFEKPTIIFFWNQKNIIYVDDETYYVSIPAICINTNDVILFSMPQYGMSNGKYFKGRDFSSKISSSDLQIEDVLNLGNKNINNILHNAHVIDGEEKVILDIDKTLYYKNNEYLHIPNYSWLVQMLKSEFDVFINEIPNDSFVYFNTRTMTDHGDFSALVLSSFDFKSMSNKYIFSPNNNSLELYINN
tara:strand:+ start:4348 stop:6333 length:1986 start_codon:yes stop_codon:yes gene_type:complete